MFQKDRYQPMYPKKIRVHAFLSPFGTPGVSPDIIGNDLFENQEDKIIHYPLCVEKKLWMATVFHIVLFSVFSG